MLRQKKAATGAFGKRRITRGTSRCLQTKPGRRIYRDMADGQRNTEQLAIASAELRPGVSIGRQCVMDMNGRKPTEAKTTQYMEKNDGITTSGQPHPEVGIRLEAGGEKNAYPHPKIS